MPTMPMISNVFGEGKGLLGGGGTLSDATFSSIGGAVSDLFAAEGDKYKAAGARAEEQNYLQAAEFADQNAVFTEWSTKIKEAQTDREIYQSIGGTRADVAGAGFGESGSAIDILRESAGQGALMKAVLGEQGLIQQQGYEEQAQSYRNMASAAEMTAKADENAATGAWVSAGIKGIAAIASLV